MRTLALIGIVIGFALGWGCFTPSGLQGYRARQVEQNPAIASMESAERVIGWGDWFRANPFAAGGAALLDGVLVGGAGWLAYEAVDAINGDDRGNTTINVNASDNAVVAVGEATGRAFATSSRSSSTSQEQ